MNGIFTTWISAGFCPRNGRTFANQSSFVHSLLRGFLPQFVSSDSNISRQKPGGLLEDDFPSSKAWFCGSVLGFRWRKRPNEWKFLILTILWIDRIYPVISFPPGWHHISLALDPYKMTKASLIVTWWMDPMHPTLHDDRFMLGPTGYCDLWFSSRWLRMAMPVCKGIRTLPSRDLHVDFSAKWCVFSLLQQGDVMKILFVFLLSSCPLGIVPLKDTKQQSQFLKVSVPLKYASQKHDRFSGILTETRVFRISTPCLGDGLEIPQNHHLTKTQSL